MVNIPHSNADFLFSSQTALENVGLKKLSFTDVAENFVSETPLNFNPCGLHDFIMKDIKVNRNDSIFILHLNISSLQNTLTNCMNYVFLFAINLIFYV